MHLSGKKLLVLSGSNGSKDIVQYAKSRGAITIATDFLKESPAKKLADYSHDVSTTDIDGVIDLARDYKVNGITTGTSEASMFTILQACKVLGLPFYATDNQLDTINNKRKFKELLINHQVPVIPEHSQAVRQAAVNVSKMKLPLVIKPVDSSGAKGISVVREIGALQPAINNALAYSRKKEFIAEEFMEGLAEVFVNYTLVDGCYKISSSFDIYRHPKRKESDLVALPLLYRSPSKYLRRFEDEVDSSLCEAFRALDLKNGVISIQTFVTDKSFYVYEAGYRLGGAQMYIFTKELNGVSVLEMMVDFSIFGKMSQDPDVLHKENPHFHKPCCQLNIPLSPGRIATISGLDEAENMDGVLNITQNHFVGDQITEDGSIRQLGFRVHLTANDEESLRDKAGNLYRILDVRNDEGNQMLLGSEQLMDCWR